MESGRSRNVPLHPSHGNDGLVYAKAAVTSKGYGIDKKGPLLTDHPLKRG